MPSEIDWDRLTPRGAWRLLHLALPSSCGVSNRELADQTGETVVWVAKQLELLRVELATPGLRGVSRTPTQMTPSQSEIPPLELSRLSGESFQL